MFVSIKKHIATIHIASNEVLKSIVKKAVNITIVLPVFHIIIDVSAVSCVSTVSRASFCKL